MSKTFVLVHGAWHGGWAWEKVAKALASEGHTVITPDLPGHGDDRRPPGEVTMDAYVDSISRVVGEQSGKVILTGHSMSGAVISQVGERHPDKIESLVYLCAFLLPNGKSVLQVMGEDHEAEFGPRLSFNDDQSGASFDEATFRETFYNEVAEADIQWALPQLPEYQATAPLASPIKVSEQGFGSLPRYYIRCLQDKVLSPQMQRQLIQNQPCVNVYEIDADHVPFISNASATTDALLDIAKGAER